MLRKVDRSKGIATFLESFSARMAKQRGLAIMIGIGLVIVSFIVSLINTASPTPLLDWIWTITHHLGIIIALIGIMLVEPLGR